MFYLDCIIRCSYIRVTFKTNKMETYNVVKLENGQSVVKELNANVLTNTFVLCKRTEFADLYSSSNSCDCLVLHRSCSPINDTFIKTVILNF